MFRELVAEAEKEYERRWRETCRTIFLCNDELVFVSAYKGSHVDPRVYAETFRAALARAGITDYVRPFHDGRIRSASSRNISPARCVSRRVVRESECPTKVIEACSRRPARAAFGWGLRCGESWTLVPTRVNTS